MDLRPDVIKAIEGYRDRDSVSDNDFQKARIEYCPACGQVRVNGDTIQNGMGDACSHELKPITPFINIFARKKK